MEITAKTKKVAVKREIAAMGYSDFCTLCGHRYEQGATDLVVLTTSPTARGRIAHRACVVRVNKAIDAAIAREQENARLGRISPPRVAALGGRTMNETIALAGTLEEEGAR